LQRQRIEADDRRQAGMIYSHSVLVTRVMRKVGTGNHQCAAFPQRRGQRARERLTVFSRRFGDDDGHELFARLDALQERQLHLDRVFSLVRAALERDAAIGLHQRSRQLTINRHVTHRHGKRAFGPDGTPARHRIGMVRAQDDDGIIIHALSLLECLRRDVA
jgi:hypothetical protein